MAAGRLIPVRAGDIEVEVEVEAVPVAGTAATSGRAAKAAGNVLEAFSRAQAAIVALARPATSGLPEPGGPVLADAVEGSPS